jgi:hypothetical protein
MKYCDYLLFLSLSACVHENDYSQKSFEREKWLANPKMKDVHNPRAYMTDDLLQNVLTLGCGRDSILLLLGDPYSEKVT